MRVAPETVAGLCRVRARDLLRTGSGDLGGVDPVKLLWGIAGVESTYGLNSNPRHENGYCYNGRYFDAKLTDEWGCLAHCSFGPWQVMFPNFPNGVSAISLLPQGDGHVAADLSAMAAVAILNQAIARGARNLSDIVIAYNGPGEVPEYARRLFSAMERPLPQYVDPVIA